MKVDSKAVKSLQFSGKRKDFDAFKLKYMSWAGLNDLKKILTGEEKVPKYGIDYGLSASDDKAITPTAKIEELMEKISRHSLPLSCPSMGPVMRVNRPS